MVRKYLAVFLAVIVAGVNAGEQDVVELTDNDFSTRIAEFDTTLVMFYAPWWVHLREFIWEILVMPIVDFVVTVLKVALTHIPGKPGLLCFI